MEYADAEVGLTYMAMRNPLSFFDNFLGRLFYSRDPDVTLGAAQGTEVDYELLWEKTKVTLDDLVESILGEVGRCYHYLYTTKCLKLVKRKYRHSPLVVYMYIWAYIYIAHY